MEPKPQSCRFGRGISSWGLPRLGLHVNLQVKQPRKSFTEFGAEYGFMPDWIHPCKHIKHMTPVGCGEVSGFCAAYDYQGLRLDRLWNPWTEMTSCNWAGHNQSSSPLRVLRTSGAKPQARALGKLKATSVGLLVGSISFLTV